MPKKLHPADLADLTKIEAAKHFNVHLRTGPHEKINRRAKSLAAAIRIADNIGATAGGRMPMIYAVTAEKLTVHVPAASIARARQEMAHRRPDTAPQRGAGANAASRPLGKRAAILVAAEGGQVPDAPDFSAETHKRFRPKLAKVIAMVEAGDLKGLKAFKVNPVSSSPKAIAKYRDLAVIALEARAKMGGSPAASEPTSGRPHNSKH